MRHRVRQGDKFEILGASDAAHEMRVRVTVQLDNGKLRNYVRTLVTTADRVITQGRFTGAGMEQPGEVVRAVVAGVTTGFKRGQTFVELLTVNRNLETVDTLLQDYLYAGNNPSLGRFHGPGPGEGNGNKQNRVLVANAAPADLEHRLGRARELRRIDGFIWYYHCSGDAATRTMRVSLRDLGDGLPTGMTSGNPTTVKTWPSAGVLSLIANQEGVVYVNANTGKSFAASIDSGVRTIEDTTTQPDPFPYWARSPEVGEFFFDVTDEEAADRHTITIIEEDWHDP